MTSVNQKRLPSLSQQRIPGLDLLRSLAIIFVICHHYASTSQHWFIMEVLGPIFSVLWSGVDLFFVLSGFLIASQWFVSLEKDSLSWAYKKFYIKRCFRILPSYWIVFFLYSLQATFLTHHEFNIWQYIFFVQNFYELPIFGVSWSLCVEEHFYLIFPALAFIIWKFNKYWLGIFAGLGSIALTLYLRDYYWNLNVKDIYNSLPLHQQGYESFKTYYSSIYFPTYTRLDGLTCGVALAAWRHYLPQWWLRVQKQSQWIAWLGVIGWIASLMLVYNKYQWASAVFGFLSLALSYSCLVFAASEPTNWLGKLKIPGTEKISHLSYAMYLIFPGVLTLMSVLIKKVPFLKGEPFYSIIQISIILMASQFLYWAVEKPSLNWRRKYLKKMEPRKN